MTEMPRLADYDVRVLADEYGVPDLLFTLHLVN